MKKFFTLIVCAFASMAMSAQDLIFVDAQGNEIKSGSTIVMNEAEVNDFDELMVPLKGISIKNTTSDDVSFNMNAVVTSLPNGNFACCFGQNCRSISKTGTIELKNLNIAANETVLLANTEWVGEEGSYGTCAVDFQISEGLSEGSKITVKFVYADPSGIKDVTATAKTNNGIFSLNGQRLNSLQKGINIVNGKKVIMK